MKHAIFSAAVFWVCFLMIGCARTTPNNPVSLTVPGKLLPRTGDEIVVCGQMFHTGTPVVLWTDPGGYDAYRTERRFSPWEVAGYEATKTESKEIAAHGPARFGIRRNQIDDTTFERVRGGGWDLPTLQKCVDQFVYHYDVCGVSRNCFRTLQDERGLSVHFMLDVDGTIYQTLDLKERAWHATRSNDRSIGIEIANMGSYQNLSLVSEWYTRDPDGRLRITIPYRFGDGGLRLVGPTYRPARNEAVTGTIQGEKVRQYDFTPQQYAALIRLTATLCTVFPKINCDAPREADGQVVSHVLSDSQWANYQGLLGHFHVDRNKPDPGPAFDWEKVIAGAREVMTKEAKAANQKELGRPALPVR